MKLLITIAGIAFAGCTAQPEQKEVSAAFRQIMRGNGWVLAHFGRDATTLFPFTSNGDQRLELNSEKPYFAFSSSSDGSCLVYVIEPLEPSGFEVVIADSRGRERRSDARFAQIRGLAVAPGCERFAVDGVRLTFGRSDQRGVVRTNGLFYGDMTDGVIHAVAQVPDNSDPVATSMKPQFEPSWSADGSRLAFESKNSLFVYDTRTNESLLLMAGRRPRWSPNGRWLGYQDLRDIPMILELETHISKPLVDMKTKCLWSLNWTPDSQFAFFTQQDRNRTILRSCRLQDHAVGSLFQTPYDFRENRFALVTRTVLPNLLQLGPGIHW